MNLNECELIRQAVMARADGEAVALPTGQIEAHLARCAECRREAEAMQSLSALLAAQARRKDSAELWPSIAPQLASVKRPTAQPDSAGFFVVLGLILLVYQSALFFGAPALWWWFKAAVVLAIIALLALRRMNPFIIEPELLNIQKGAI